MFGSKVKLNKIYSMGFLLYMVSFLLGTILYQIAFYFAFNKGTLDQKISPRILYKGWTFTQYFENEGRLVGVFDFPFFKNLSKAIIPQHGFLVAQGYTQMEDIRYDPKIDGR